MRHGARVAARGEPAPASILGRLDEALAEESGRALCTALCLRLAEDHVVISSAGHPPAIIVAQDGRLREVPKPGPVLGAFDDASWPEERVTIDPGELLVMYTDGVIETVGKDERFGTKRLRALLSSQAGNDPKTVLEQLEAALTEFASGVATDDVAALALRR
jgi:serine phosphatase RsbU (regulator of sigma subunit)